MSSGKFLSGVVVGAAAGALVALFVTSEKGAKLRKKIRRQSNDLKDKLTGVVDEMVEKYESAADKAAKVKKAAM